MQEHAALRRGSKLPLVRLTSAVDEAETALVVGRGPQVAVVVHSLDCAPCRQYVQELAEALPRFTEWGARFVVVVPGSVAGGRAMAEELPRSARVLADPQARLPAWGPAVIVADEWGEVFFAVGMMDAHDLPTAEELVDWARFVAIQCEECEMPEGGWKTI